MSRPFESFDSCNLGYSATAEQNSRLETASQTPMSMDYSLGVDTRTFVPAIIVLIFTMISATFFLVYFFKKSLSAQMRRCCSIFSYVVAVIFGLVFFGFSVAGFALMADIQRNGAKSLNCATNSIPTELFEGGPGFIGLDRLRSLVKDTSTGVGHFEEALPALETLSSSNIVSTSESAISAIEYFRDEFSTRQVDGVFAQEVPATFGALPDLLLPPLSELRDLSTASNSAIAALRKYSEVSNGETISNLQKSFDQFGLEPEKLSRDFAKQPHDWAISAQVAMWVLFAMALISIFFYILDLIFVCMGHEKRKAFKYSFVIAASFSIFFAAVVVVLQQQNESLRFAQLTTASILSSPTPSALLTSKLTPLAWLFDGCLGSTAVGLATSAPDSFGVFDFLDLRKALRRLSDPFIAGISLSNLATILDQLRRFQSVDTLELNAQLNKLNEEAHCSGVSYQYSQANCLAFGCVEIGSDAAFVQDNCITDLPSAFLLYQKLATAKETRISAYSDALEALRSGVSSPIEESAQVSFLKDSIASKTKDFAATFQDKDKIPVDQWDLKCADLRPKLLVIEKLLFDTNKQIDKVIACFIIAAALMVLGLWAILFSWIFSGARTQKVDNAFITAKVSNQQTESIAQPDKIDQLILKGT